MNKETIETLIRQAFEDGTLEIECPTCGKLITTEADAQELYCHDCKKVTGKNPLAELGLI